MRVVRPGNRSSLVSHTFPSFYACYLLKSVKSPTSNATYIGSTPNPPRRIRQHNGELTQGAWKTQKGRPWVMQMIVHGFPSKLAALQFEWAWQHPNLSRHIRDENGKVFASTGRTLKQNIQILRFMISIHPYNVWPLHLKVFTPQALQVWEELTNTGKAVKGKGKEKANAIRSSALPLGFSCTVEFEGVDGKSKGRGGSGRTGPIDVNDEKFTTDHLQKAVNVLSPKNQLKCVVCDEFLTKYATEPLAHALCPQESCHGTAHLLCLSNDFLSQAEPNSPMVPRGGHCPTCTNYVLWGDVVKGCYRRAAGGAVSVEEEEEALNNMYSSDSLESTSNAIDGKGTKTEKRKVSPRKKRQQQQLQSSGSSSEGELFAVRPVETKLPRRGKGSLPKKLKIGHTEVTLPTPLTPSTSRKPKSVTPKKRTRATRESSEGEQFDFASAENVASTDEEAPKRKVGRPRKVVESVASSSSRLTGVAKRGRLPKVSPRIAPRKFSTLARPARTSEHSRVAARSLFEDADDTDVEVGQPKHNNDLVRSMSYLSVTSPSISS